MAKTDFSAIILAAGVGKRMNSEKSKVLHKIGTKPMIQKTVETLENLAPHQIIVVANRANKDELKSVIPNTTIVIQDKPLGTADATAIGLQQVSPPSIRDIAVLYGDDTAFYSPETIKHVFNFHQKSKAKITFVTIKRENPERLGRIIRSGEKLLGIIEDKDATEEQKKIREVNDGLYFFDKSYLKANIHKLKPSRTTGELYITDLIALALENHQKVETYKLDNEAEWHGINTQVELAKANFKINKSIHIMGISGAGASAIAGISKAEGYKVSGCDINPNSSYIDKSEIKIVKGHNKAHLDSISCLVISPAVVKFNPKNEEVISAKDKGLSVLTWQEFQGSILMENKLTIAVAGAYGKSTTTAMIGKLLSDTGLDPTIEIGAKMLNWGKNFRVGKSKYYVCEADEYNDNFLNYRPGIAVVLNVDWDHPDYFKSRQQAEKSFMSFINNIKDDGYLITTQEIIEKICKNIRKDIIITKISKFSNINLKIIGDFRIENANAALTLAQILKIDLEKARKSINNFSGLGRRLEFKGELGDVKFYDDYAVQPYTVQKTANALRQKYKKRKITLVLEPHTFTRVNMFFNDFVQKLKNTNVDQILITDVYAAREKGNKSSLSRKLANVIGKKAWYIGSVKDIADNIRNNMDLFDVVLTMGAGEVYKVYDLVKNG